MIDPQALQTGGTVIFTLAVLKAAAPVISFLVRIMRFSSNGNTNDNGQKKQISELTAQLLTERISQLATSKALTETETRLTRVITVNREEITARLALTEERIKVVETICTERDRKGFE